jgi:hypothetical protein
MLHAGLPLLDCVYDDVVEPPDGGRHSHVVLVINDTEISETPLHSCAVSMTPAMWGRGRGTHMVALETSLIFELVQCGQHRVFRFAS